jgi:dTDP-4-amino-4,6-dideoxygalactose transaminase
MQMDHVLVLDQVEYLNVMEKIWLSSPHMGHLEKEYLTDAFDSNWIAPLGPYVNRFENDLSIRMDGLPVAALSSGTAAIHLALILLNVKAGDRVICQSMTFSASANPIAYLGAEPVFIDSEADTWNMDPILLEQAIESGIAEGKKPKAIIPVHLYGMPAKMNDIMTIAQKYEIPVIEDAAEALGSSISGRPCGSFGDFGVLSFNGNKIITTSGGGALVAKDSKLIEKARYLSTQARDPAPHYEHSTIGYNYRLSNICAAIGCGQLVSLEEKISNRRKNFDFYKSELGRYDFVKFTNEPDSYFSNRWLSTVLIDSSYKVSAEKLRIYLEQFNIETRPLWKPMHMQPVFSNCIKFVSGVSENLFAHGLCLPSGSNLTSVQIEFVVDKIKEYFKNAS